MLLPAIAAAQTEPPFSVVGGNVQKRANAVLTLMGFTVVPDLTASALSIHSPSTGNPGINMTQFGGGFTLGTGFALYLEGSAGGSRYDPTFIATSGQEEREIPFKWTTIAGTGGIGWDFRVPFTEHLVFRPIFNFSLGHVESDSSLVGRLIGNRTDLELEFLSDGKLNAYGLGGSVMLDYELIHEKHDVDVELRYTNIYLQSFDSSSAVKGTSDAETLSLYTRWRAPTGLMLMQRPLRYVLEGANTTYLGDQAGALGFNYLTSVGIGVEIDSSAIHLVITRTRWVIRYVFGENVSGVSGGLAMSF